MARLHDDRGRAEGFGAKAEAYDRYRPSYPAELIEWLTPGSPGTAVDVGCGTGRVARLLRDAGWTVVGVEIDARMAEVARETGLEVDVSRFEDWEPTVTEVDLICSGQAWHWIDPDAGYQKAADLLRPGGRIAPFWNYYRYDDTTTATIREVYERVAPDALAQSVTSGLTRVEDRPQTEVPAALADRFGPFEWREFSHARTQTVDDWLADVRTHSIHDRLEPSVADTLFGDLRGALEQAGGGTIEVGYITIAAVAETR